MERLKAHDVFMVFINYLTIEERRAALGGIVFIQHREKVRPRHYNMYTVLITMQANKALFIIPIPVDNFIACCKRIAI